MSANKYCKSDKEEARLIKRFTNLCMLGELDKIKEMWQKEM